MLMNLVARDRGLGVGIIQMVCVFPFLTLLPQSIHFYSSVHSFTHTHTRARAGQVSIFIRYEYLKMSRIIKTPMCVSE